jgi:hypothetical protein
MVLHLGRCDVFQVPHILDCEMLASVQQKRKMRVLRITFDCPGGHDGDLPRVWRGIFLCKVTSLRMRDGAKAVSH